MRNGNRNWRSQYERRVFNVNSGRDCKRLFFNRNLILLKKFTDRAIARRSLNGGTGGVIYLAQLDRFVATASACHLGSLSRMFMLREYYRMLPPWPQIDKETQCKQKQTDKFIAICCH